LIIPLKEVVYDIRARDGTWCNHNGFTCMNFPKCLQRYPDFLSLKNFSWGAIIEEFDLEAWAESQREKHKGEGWSEKQLRNPRHWQKKVRARLMAKAIANSNRL